MVAGLLRQQIRRTVAVRIGAPHAQLRVLAIGVRFLRADTIESQIRIFHGQRPFDAERRNRRQAAVLLARILDVELNAAVRIGNVADRYFCVLRNRQFICIRGFHGVLSAGRDFAADAAGVLSRDRPGGAFEGVPGSAVVVRQRTERGDGRTTQHEFAFAERV